MQTRLLSTRLYFSLEHPPHQYFAPDLGDVLEIGPIFRLGVVFTFLLEEAELLFIPSVHICYNQGAGALEER